ncbi:MAG: phosphoribosylformylglycinamidine synthase subunit PurS [Acidobacteria bacterium]|nr:phosphoribosylformylglycinamidine synthase subunit PurS [Acidobacteriota bacterium]
MKATVLVRLKPGVLDPQGEAIRRALNKLGHPVRSVRQAKYFELELEGDLPDPARLEEISRDVLSNPIIEDFYVLGQDGGSGPQTPAGSGRRRGQQE